MALKLKKLHNEIFGKIDKKYCDYFYYLCLISFVLIVIEVLTLSSKMLLGKRINWSVEMYVSASFVLSYLANRLLYNMCKNSL